MSNTKIKSSQFHGVVGHGTDGYFLVTNGDGSMSWISNVVNPVISSLSYPGSATAADPAGGETITITGTGFKTGATVTVGGTAAPSVSYVSATSLTITTPAKAAGDYDVVVTNTDGGTATSVNGISFNGIPSWTTAAGTLGTFASDTTISTITLQATEPDGGTITFSITNGALPTGLSLTGANIDGTTTLETADTLYTFTVTATDDETQTTPRTFTITVTKQFIGTENFTINTYTGNGSTQSIEGKIGTAADFNGSSSYIENTDTSIWGATWTISLWFKTSNNSGRSPLFTFGRGNYTDGIELQAASSNTVAGSYAEGTKYFTKNVSTDLDDGNFHHYCITYDSSTDTIKLYIDGNEETGLTTGTGNSRQGSGYRIGRFFQTPEQWATGSIDQVRVFNKALSSSEVTTLYGESNTSTTKSTTDIFDDGSGVALYEFEKGAKDTGGTNGYIGAGGVFNGSSSTISTPITTNYSNLSVSCWVKFNALPTGNADATLVNKGFYVSGTNTQYLHLRYEDYTDQFTFAVRQNSTYNQQAASGVTASVGVWYHVVGTLDSSGNAQIYVNGSAGTGITSAPTMTNSDNFEIGSAGGAAVLNGTIDQVRIFDKAISSSEVTTLYGETSASATKSTTDIFSDSSGIALYELEGNANDSGRFGSGAIDSGQSAVFNGTNYIVTPELGDRTTFSYSFWMNMSNASSNDKYIFGEQVGGQIFATGGTLIIYANAGDRTFSGSPTVSDNTWHHIALSVSSGTGTIYVDGVNKGNCSYTNLSITAPLYMGTASTQAGNATYAMQGKMDQVRIYSSALSASDVEALVSETNVPTANLVAHYKLDGNANDSAGSYNGTATSITYSDPAEFPKYNGTATNVPYAYDGTPTNVSFVGTSFQPDLVWIKRRSNTEDHAWFDSVRGIQKQISSNLTAAEYTTTNAVSSFDSNGFTTGNNGATNTSSQTYVSWMWKAGGSAVSNTDGSDTTSVSANQDAGFSIVSLSKTDTNTRTYGHGLSSAPEMIILKRTVSADDWYVYHKDLGNTVRISLNTSAANVTSTGVWGSTTPTDSVFTLQNQLGGAHIAYCFHSVDSYQKVGSYSGSNSPITVTTGFQPRFVLIKRTDTSGNSWVIIDSAREIGSGADALFPDSSAAESSSWNTDFISTGFTISSNESYISAAGGTYIYLAIA